MLTSLTFKHTHPLQHIDFLGIVYLLYTQFEKTSLRVTNWHMKSSECREPKCCAAGEMLESRQPLGKSRRSIILPPNTTLPMLYPCPCPTASSALLLTALRRLHLKYLAHSELQLVKGTQQGNGMCANAVTELTLFHGSS